MFVDQVSAAIEGARTDAQLVVVSQSIWQGLAAGALGDDDAQRLADVIHARRQALRPAQAAQGGPRRLGGMFPPRKPQRPSVRAQAIERRRRLAASAPLPPALACRFTTGELAVLRIVGDEHRDKGACLLCLDAIAARAGVCRSLAKAAIRQARLLGLLSVEERRRPGQKNLPNLIRVVDRSWLAWLVRGPRSKAIGGKKGAPSDTKVIYRQVERAVPAERNPRGRESGAPKSRSRQVERGSGAM